MKWEKPKLFSRKKKSPQPDQKKAPQPKAPKATSTSKKKSGKKFLVFDKLKGAKHTLAGFLPVVLVIVILGAIFFIIWWSTPFLDDLYALVPGYYQNKDYNDLTREKNDLIEDNAVLLEEIAVLEAELNDVSASESGYKEMVELNTEIIAKQEEVRANIVIIVEADETFQEMRLPEVVDQYMDLSYELDSARLELIDTSLEISNARKDLAEFNQLRTEFDNCLAGVNWSASDTEISQSVSKCAAKVKKMRQKAIEMEEEYDVKLDELKGYLKLLKEEWEANAAYYAAIAENDYTTANEHDQIFVERKRQISEMSVVQVFNEFFEEAITPMIEEFEELSEVEAEKEEQATEWYERNVAR